MHWYLSVFSKCYFVQSKTFTNYINGVPMSYQLWNNYLIRNQNYWEKIKFYDKSKPQILKTIKEEVKYAMNTLQPQLEKDKGCVIMLTHVPSHPNWININCFQQIPAFIVCQKIINKEKQE